jgi:hypothetical protein
MRDYELEKYILKMSCKDWAKVMICAGKDRMPEDVSDGEAKRYYGIKQNGR